MPSGPYTPLPSLFSSFLEAYVLVYGSNTSKYTKGSPAFTVPVYLIYTVLSITSLINLAYYMIATVAFDVLAW